MISWKVACIIVAMFARGVSSSNVSGLRNDLPEIKDGEKCESGKMYKMECNSCQCGPQNTLLCSKMACLQYGMEDQPRNIHDIMNETKNKDLHDKECVPGKIYKKGCSYCLCNKNKEITHCNLDSNCTMNRRSSSKTAISEILRQMSNNVQMQDLPVLSHAAAACDAGVLYRVECNVCYCFNDGNLLCGNNLCPSYDEVNKRTAKKLSGKPCKEENDAKVKCIKCICKGYKQQCSAIPDCLPMTSHSLVAKPLLRIDMQSEPCVPGMIYTLDCNKCYCDTSRQLMCTQKMCLNKKQSLKLEEHIRFLEIHGL